MHKAARGQGSRTVLILRVLIGRSGQVLDTRPEYHLLEAGVGYLACQSSRACSPQLPISHPGVCMPRIWV